mmetsp:Transcript_137864/g.274871  ORF Transcript_137864/g.274871 Transcript_137864/m.274871 type:complete len:217 (-) Transcript_137864:1006-1656(-)
MAGGFGAPPSVNPPCKATIAFSSLPPSVSCRSTIELATHVPPNLTSTCSIGATTCVSSPRAEFVDARSPALPASVAATTNMAKRSWRSCACNGSGVARSMVSKPTASSPRLRSAHSTAKTTCSRFCAAPARILSDDIWSQVAPGHRPSNASAASRASEPVHKIRVAQAGTVVGCVAAVTAEDDAWAAVGDTVAAWRLRALMNSADFCSTFSTPASR